VFDFVTQRRLEVARQLLQESELQIRQIADRIGYLNPGDFTRAFRRQYGITPRSYRRGEVSEDEDAE
jgi:AraC-like DNA-binding protein